ncbi:methyltransferase domain-containing protein [Spirulina subsalsa]|uniref:methyltransferase domain-containing protein n=1 Tax=Spirulina subsalsa TaxID=54311 RepID=UPI00030E7EA0|nr:methyltransferase domain-containing protein [Spirulina subsalsa]
MIDRPESYPKSTRTASQLAFVFKSTSKVPLEIYQKIRGSLKQSLKFSKISLKTLVRKYTGKSDTERWSQVTNLHQSWDTRTQQMAALLTANSSVLEFGAGRMVLKQHLPAGCSYTPSDLVDRGENTLICDLNAATLPAFPAHDVAVFSGVLEYVNDVPKLISHLAPSVKVILASYAVYEKNTKERRRRGWVNDYTSNEFIALFAERGFQCVHTEIWQSQVIHKFMKFDCHPQGDGAFNATLL